MLAAFLMQYQLLDHLARLWRQQHRIILRRDADLAQARWPFVKHVAGAVDQALTKCAVADNQYAYHELIELLSRKRNTLRPLFLRRNIKLSHT